VNPARGNECLGVTAGLVNLSEPMSSQHWGCGRCGGRGSMLGLEMQDHVLWVRRLRGNGVELFGERKRVNRKRGTCLYVDVIIWLQKGSYWVRSNPGEGWETAPSQSVLGGVASGQGLGRAQSAAGSWSPRGQGQRQALAVAHKGFGAIRSAYTQLSTLRASLKKRICPPGTQREALSYAHSHKYHKKKSC